MNATSSPVSSGGVPVGPEDCALAVALPLTLSDCEAQLENPIFEFVRTQVVTVGNPSTVRDAWDRFYGPYIKRVRAMVDAIGKGLPVVGDSTPIEVRWDVTLADVSALLRRYHVVTVLAHSPFRLPVRADFVSARDILDTLAAPPGPTDHEVVRALRSDAEVMRAGDDTALIKTLRSRINDARSYYHKETKDAGCAPKRDEASDVMRLTPMSLYEAFPTAIKPPLVVELADGMHNFEAVVAAVPEAFSGNLQFLTCSGAWFLPALRRRRKEAEDYPCPHHEARLLERVQIYRVGIERLAFGPIPYRDAVNFAHLEAIRWKRERNDKNDRPCTPQRKAP